jgi:Mor family transcriptional regulator
MSIEKKDRNDQIYCEKRGLENIFDKKPTKKPISFTQLSYKWKLSVTRLQTIIRKTKKKVRKNGRSQSIS